MKVKYDDGGRLAAGFTGLTGDCCCRAVAICTERPYRDVYVEMKAFAKNNETKARIRNGGQSSVRMGYHTTTLRKYMKSIGWEWTPTMHIGQGCKVHLKDGEIPMNERVLCCVSKHFVAVVNGVIHDNYNPQRGGTRCVYGYYTKPL